jgi:hypothetical protein
VLGWQVTALTCKQSGPQQAHRSTAPASSHQQHSRRVVEALAQYSDGLQQLKALLLEQGRSLTLSVTVCEQQQVLTQELVLLLFAAMRVPQVYPGPEGKARFQQQIRELVKLSDDEEFEVEFECKAPDSGACAG